MIKVIQLPLGPIQTNCYILGCEQTGTAALIDPSWEGKGIVAAANEQGFEVSHILLTHTHFDHVGGLAEVKQLTNAPIYVHPDAVAMMKMADATANLWGFPMIPPPPADELLQVGQKLKVGKLELEVLYTPGHAPGHVCFYLPAYQLLFAGDVIFQQSIGRTDLPGGNYPLLMRSIREKLLVLPDETQILPGHGPITTIGEEKQFNPFLQE